MLEKLTVDDFAPYLGQTFTIRLNSGEAYALMLEKAQAAQEEGLPGGRKPFWLEFSNPRIDAYLPQQTYCLEHPQMGALELFIVPLGPDKAGMRYEVVFG